VIIGNAGLSGMSNKGKGGRTERELIHLFHDTGNFAPIRIAGSGSTPLPAPDIVVGGKGKVFAIECKSGKKERYIDPQQIKELLEFSAKFGAIPLVGVRFDREGWWFLAVNDLKQSKAGNYRVDLELAKEKGVSFNELIS